MKVFPGCRGTLIALSKIIGSNFFCAAFNLSGQRNISIVVPFSPLRKSDITSKGANAAPPEYSGKPRSFNRRPESLNKVVSFLLCLAALISVSRDSITASLLNILGTLR